LNNPPQTYPSIFNDVIGPVMRGPSSSHCAAAVRIGLIVRDLMDGEIQDVLIQFDPDGSLATTHESQGSDMGLFGGFLGWDAADKRLANSLKGIQEAGIKIKIEITPIDAAEVLLKWSRSIASRFRWQVTTTKPLFILKLMGIGCCRT